MGLLIPDTGLLFWMTLSFGVVVLVLARFGFPSIIRGIEQRRKHIAHSLEAAKQAGEKVAGLEVKAQQIIDKANAESGKILAETRATRDKILEDARRAAAQQTAKSLEKASAEAEELKRKAMDEVMGEIAGISVKIAGKVLGEELKDDKAQRKLIDRMLSEEIKQ